MAIFRLTAAALLLMATSIANATIIFEDNFDGENGGVGALNYSGFANWTVSDGTVDLIGNGYFDFLPGNGLYIDMDGSTSDAGAITSADFFFVNGAFYTLTFDLAGNHRNGSEESVIVSAGVRGLNDVEIYYPANTANQPFNTYSYNFFGDGAFHQIYFAGTGGDNIGLLLDNVRLEVPEPATLALFGLGLLGLGFTRRRKD